MRTVGTVGLTVAAGKQKLQGIRRKFCYCVLARIPPLRLPARYCTKYLGDIGVPPLEAPMDFAGCMEVYLGGAWHVFDPRNNARRIGRLVIARGRDAADVATSTAFGMPYLQKFLVWTEDISEAQANSFKKDTDTLMTSQVA